MLWLILGLLVGAAVVLAVRAAQRSHVQVRWYEWLLGALGVVGLLLTIEASVGSFAENEARAGWMAVATLGIPSVVLLAIGLALPWRRTRAADASGLGDASEEPEPVV